MRDISLAPMDGTHVLGYGIHMNDCDDNVVGFCEVYYSEDMQNWYNILYYPSIVASWDYLPEITIK